MQRRRFIAATAAGLLGGLSGCATALSGGAAGEAATLDPVAEDPTLPVPEHELTYAAGRDAIPSIVDPVFGPDWGGIDVDLPDDATVIGIERRGTARAYPLRILNWHEVVNDDFDGPLLVTYCPLCDSGVTVVRRVGGRSTVFGVSGQLWKSDLVLYDRATDSLWSQIRAQAIRGPRTGDRIALVPSTVTSWGAWQAEHPSTSVLLPPPASGTIGTGARTRPYEQDPYDGYADDLGVGIANRNFADDRLHTKTTVIGVTHDGTARAYPLPRVRTAGIINDTVSGLPVVVTTDPSGSLVAYDRTVDGQVLTFEQADERHLEAGGSRWRVVSGIAAQGPHEGARLSRANDGSPKFWFAWATFHSNSSIYGG